MTWGLWRALHPDTLVMSEDTGHPRAYATANPYEDYRDGPGPVNFSLLPEPDESHESRSMVFGLFLNGEKRVYPWSEIERISGERRGLFQDTVAGTRIAVVFDLDAEFVHAYILEKDQELSLEHLG